MAAPVMSRRLTVLCRTFKGNLSLNPLNSRSSVGILVQSASYNPKRLGLVLNQPYIPNKGSEKTPEWQKNPKYDAKLFGHYGSASGIDPATLWPSAGQLEQVIAEEQEWNPPLAVMLKNIEIREKEDTEKRLAKEKLIASNMAKMPKMVADWRREKREAKQKQRDTKARNEKLLNQAKERFGYAVDPRSPKFLEMVAEIEKEDKKKKKLIKRQLKEEQVAAAAAPVAAPAASS